MVRADYMHSTLNSHSKVFTEKITRIKKLKQGYMNNSHLQFLLGGGSVQLPQLANIQTPGSQQLAGIRQQVAMHSGQNRQVQAAMSGGLLAPQQGGPPPPSGHPIGPGPPQMVPGMFQNSATLANSNTAPPLIKEVWAHNLEQEFASLRSFVNDSLKQIFISVHEEIPGIVARPMGTFKLSLDYHFQTLRSNSDLLSLIQLSLCVVKMSHQGDVLLPDSPSVIFQFNFHYDLQNEMYNEEHLAMLAQTAQINFPMHLQQGIPHIKFAELAIELGLLLDLSIGWILYHAGYDLGFLVRMLVNDALPSEEKDFSWWCGTYFPSFYDLKNLGNALLKQEDKVTKPSIEYLAEELHLLPILPIIRQYFSQGYSGQAQMTLALHSYLAMECFKELLKKTGPEWKNVLESLKGVIWGLGGGSIDVGDIEPSKSLTGGAIHFGRPL